MAEIRNICNLGTGTMGFGTALVFAAAGFNVRMFGRSHESVDRGLRNIGAGLRALLQHDFLSEDDIPEITGRIRGVTSLEEASEEADFVIESVPEDLELKRNLFASMDRLCPTRTIFATNTSGLSPTAIAEKIDRKEKFLVTHFWNPPHLIPLVEIVPCEQTSTETLAAAEKLMLQAGKKPVVLKREAPGFIGNRLQLALLREAFHIVESGIAEPEEVDATVRYSLGRRLGVTGPLESADLGGLDVFLSISDYLNKDLCAAPGVSPLLRDTVARGAMGAKTGTGLYEWTPESLAKIREARERELLEWMRKDNKG